jgi:hypothetical protein
LTRTLETIGSSQWVLIESATNKPRMFESAEAMLSSQGTGPTSASSDIPGMLQAARDYIRANKAGRTEVWICSDIRENDWNASSGRWRALRDAFLEFAQGVRFHLLSYPETAPSNLSVRVTEVRRRKAGDGAELLVSLRLVREGGGDERAMVPVQFEIDGARSELTVEMAGPRYELKDHRIALARGRERGWGKVTIPADANPADNDYWFAYDEPAPRVAVIVAEDAQAAQPLQLAAGIPPDPALHCSAQVVAPEQLATVEWDKTALLLWQAPLPEGDAAKPIRAFIERGGQALFFPPRAPGGGELFGARWTSWTDAGQEAGVENWRGDEDLLAHTQSGAALPVGEVRVRKHCGLSGEFTTLATLRGGAPLLARVATNRGGAYFCTTTAALGDSSLASNGVVLYVLVQRAMASGAEVLGSTRQLVAGDPQGEDPARWKQVGGTEEAISTDYPLHRGVYDSGGRLLAVNRPLEEDAAPVLAGSRVAELFRGLDFTRVDDRAGNLASLIQEIWRVFLVAMMMALMVEAGLCLPKRAQPARGTSP